MSEAGLPGTGVKLGPELFRGPKGIWYSGAADDGVAVGVLRFDDGALAGEGALPALIQRVVEVRAGQVPGALTVVDLVEDDGRVWLITAEVPVRETAAVTEELLLAPGTPGAGAGDAGAGTPAAAAVPRESHVGLVVRILVGIALVGGIAGAATIAGLKLKDKHQSSPLEISGISVANPGGYTSSSICSASLPMTALLQTNGGSGTVTYEWDLPGTAPVKVSKQISGASPQAVHLDWQLRLHGKGTVTAKFVVDSTSVLVSGTSATESTSLPYQCP